jgi:hypothetical protein
MVLEGRVSDNASSFSRANRTSLCTIPEGSEVQVFSDRVSFQLEAADDLLRNNPFDFGGNSNRSLILGKHNVLKAFSSSKKDAEYRVLVPRLMVASARPLDQSLDIPDSEPPPKPQEWMTNWFGCWFCCSRKKTVDSTSSGSKALEQAYAKLCSDSSLV